MITVYYISIPIKLVRFTDLLIYWIYWFSQNFDLKGMKDRVQTWR